MNPLKKIQLRIDPTLGLHRLSNNWDISASSINIDPSIFMQYWTVMLPVSLLNELVTNSLFKHAKLPSSEKLQIHLSILHGEQGTYRYAASWNL